jgi:hypothetical protein
MQPLYCARAQFLHHPIAELNYGYDKFKFEPTARVTSLDWARARPYPKPRVHFYYLLSRVSICWTTSTCYCYSILEQPCRLLRQVQAYYIRRGILNPNHHHGQVLLHYTKSQIHSGPSTKYVFNGHFLLIFTSVSYASTEYCYLPLSYLTSYCCTQQHGCPEIVSPGCTSLRPLAVPEGLCVSQPMKGRILEGEVHTSNLLAFNNIPSIPSLG